MGTESQFSIPPSAESITDEQDHGNSMEDMLRRMELQMIEALAKCVVAPAFLVQE
ncbi:hypothetical protein BC830DRAFT_1175984 [Chytriomyces sp. MP71]|nr:hypothetical protein BC830DRAFT_1175984 [Chytriomyces sp. MP71]